MRVKKLPPSHSKIAKTSNYIGLAYKNKENYEKALKYINGMY